MSAFTDETLQLINRELGLRNDLLRQFALKYKKTTWDAMADQAKTGRADEFWNIGDIVACNYTATNGTVYEFPWAIAGFPDVYWEGDEFSHPGILLQAVYATLESVQFDAPEDTVVPASETTAQDGWYYWGLTGSNYTALNLSAGATIPHGEYDSIHKCTKNNLDVLRYGYNRYRDSAQRQWVNSEEEAGNWWQSTHDGDIAPAQLGSVNGFLHGLDADFKAVINPIKIQVATNTVTDGGVTDVMYDRFFLPSVEEMYGSPQAPGIEGSYFPYWKDKTGLDAPSNNAVSGRIITALENHSSAQNVRLRSAYRGAGHHAWGCYASGYLYNYYGAYNASRCAPACVIS